MIHAEIGSVVVRGARPKRASLHLQTIVLMISAATLLGAAEISLPTVTVGENLEVPISLALKTRAPEGGVQVKLTSEDPKRLLFSMDQDKLGKAEITLNMPAGRTGSHEFYVQGLGKSGTATYTASAPGYDVSKGTVTLVPSAIVIAGPAKFGNPLVTTPGSSPPNLTVYSAQLNPELKFVGVQQVRGGFSATIHVSSSDPSTATIAAPLLIIEGGNYTAVTKLNPARKGTTTISVDVPQGFSAPAHYATVEARVRVPALALPDQITIGKNLELGGSLSTGELAPVGGLNVTLTSGDETKLLLSNGATDPGKKSISVLVPARGYSGGFFLHALGDSGSVTYTASAPGFQTREATINLWPSGIIITGPLGTPDEAELLRPDAPVGPNGFFVKKGSPAIPVVVYSVRLDPVTHRCADITVQPLRAGVSVKVELTNGNPAVGTLGSSVTIEAGSAQGYTEFKPLSVGTTIITVSTPAGYIKPTNATALKGVVTE